MVRAPGWGQPVPEKTPLRERGRWTSRRSTSRRNRGKGGKKCSPVPGSEAGPDPGCSQVELTFCENPTKVATTNEAAATLVSFVSFWLVCDLFKVWWRILWLHALVRGRSATTEQIDNKIGQIISTVASSWQVGFLVESGERGNVVKLEWSWVTWMGPQLFGTIDERNFGEISWRIVKW